MHSFSLCFLSEKSGRGSSDPGGTGTSGGTGEPGLSFFLEITSAGHDFPLRFHTRTLDIKATTLLFSTLLFPFLSFFFLAVIISKPSALFLINAALGIATSWFQVLPPVWKEKRSP